MENANREGAQYELNQDDIICNLNREGSYNNASELQKQSNINEKFLKKETAVNEQDISDPSSDLLTVTSNSSEGVTNEEAKGLSFTGVSDCNSLSENAKNSDKDQQKASETVSEDNYEEDSKTTSQIDDRREVNNLDFVNSNENITKPSVESGNLPDQSSKEATSSNEDSKENTTEEWMDILGSGHLLKKVLKAGIPDTRPQKSDICILNLIGRVEDGTVVERFENLQINLSDNEVIQGLDFALALMDKGEVAEVKVSPRFGYGSLGRKPDIPPDATLLYTVTLLDVKEEPHLHTLNVNDRICYGLKKKERGNWWYARDENTLAIICYRRALEYLDDTQIPEPHSEEEVRKLLEERLKTYNNLGAAQMKIEAFDAALMSVNNVLTAQPANVKALFRKAKILKEKGELQESINVIKQALSHEPDSQTLHQELSLLMAAQRKINSKQRELYKKMMGTSSNQSGEDKKQNKSNYKTFTLIAAVSFAVAVLGTIVVKYKF